MISEMTGSDNTGAYTLPGSTNDSWWESAWSSVVEWSQNFTLSLSGDAIFWAPIVLLFVGILCLWVLTAIKPLRIVGWLLSAVLIASAVLTWTHLWDWRADQYETELADHIVGTELLGDTIEAEDISSNTFGVLQVNMDLEYEFGFAEVFVIEDTEDLIDHLVLGHVLRANNVAADVDNDYLSSTMRSFQEIHVNLQSSQNEDFDETLAYSMETLVAYADTLRLRELNGNGTSESENSDEEELGDSGYSMIRTGGSAWQWADAQASEGGIELGQWAVLQTAPDALESVNGVSCAVLNGFSECASEGDEETAGVGPANTIHSALLLAIIFFGVIVIAILIEAGLRTWAFARKLRLSSSREVPTEEREIDRAAGREKAFQKNAGSKSRSANAGTDSTEYRPRRARSVTADSGGEKVSQ